MPTSIEAIGIVSNRMEPLGLSFAFIGGAVLGLLVDDAKLSQVRSTKDVDVVVEILTYGEYAALEARLRKAGFKHDTSAGAPICRWMVDGCLVDVLPKDSAALGMNSKWFPEVLREAQLRDIGMGCKTCIISPALFLATKLEAFKDRGQGDYLLSRDLGDIITLVDGRASIIDDVSSSLPSIRASISEGFSELLKNPYFREAVPEHLPAIQGSRQRLPILMKRLETIARSGRP